MRSFTHFSKLRSVYFFHFLNCYRIVFGSTTQKIRHKECTANLCSTYNCVSFVRGQFKESITRPRWLFCNICEWTVSAPLHLFFLCLIGWRAGGRRLPVPPLDGHVLNAMNISPSAIFWLAIHQQTSAALTQTLLNKTRHLLRYSCSGIATQMPGLFSSTNMKLIPRGQAKKMNNTVLSVLKDNLTHYSYWTIHSRLFSAWHNALTAKHLFIAVFIRHRIKSVIRSQ